MLPKGADGKPLWELLAQPDHDQPDAFARGRFQGRGEIFLVEDGED